MPSYSKRKKQQIQCGLIARQALAKNRLLEKQNTLLMNAEDRDAFDIVILSYLNIHIWILTTHYVRLRYITIHIYIQRTYSYIYTCID